MCLSRQIDDFTFCPVHQRHAATAPGNQHGVQRQFVTQGPGFGADFVFTQAFTCDALELPVVRRQHRGVFVAVKILAFRIDDHGQTVFTGKFDQRLHPGQAALGVIGQHHQGGVMQLFGVNLQHAVCCVCRKFLLVVQAQKLLVLT